MFQKKYTNPNYRYKPLELGLWMLKSNFPSDIHAWCFMKLYIMHAKNLLKMKTVEKLKGSKIVWAGFS